MQKGHFWPLEARKQKKKGFLGNKFFCVLWPPEAKNDPHSENTKKINFEKNFLVFNAKRSYSASRRPKNAKNYSGDPKMLTFSFSGLQRPKMTFLHKIQKVLIFFVFTDGG